METPIVNNYEYHGLGIPVILKQVQLVNLRGDWYPQIDVEQVATELFESLLKKAKTTLLTEEEMEFIRIHLNLSQTQFNFRDCPCYFGTVGGNALESKS